MLSFTARLAALSLFTGAMVAAGGSSAAAQTQLDACDQPQMSVPVSAAPLGASSNTAPAGRPKAKKPRPVKAAAVKSEAPKPDAAKPEPAKPEPVKPEGEKADARKADDAKPEAAKPKAAKAPSRRPTRQARKDDVQSGAAPAVIPATAAPAAAPSRACTVRSAVLVPGLPSIPAAEPRVLHPANHTPVNLTSAAAPVPADDIASFLPPQVSVETATVPELSNAMVRYGVAYPSSVMGAVVILVAVNPDQAVKIATAAQSAWPERALELAMAIANTAPQAAIQIIAVLAKVDPALAPALASMILPANGGINQTSSSRGSSTVQQEIPVRTTPHDSSASPTGRG